MTQPIVQVGNSIQYSRDGDMVVQLTITQDDAARPGETLTQQRGEAFPQPKDWTSDTDVIAAVQERYSAAEVRFEPTWAERQLLNVQVEADRLLAEAKARVAQLQDGVSPGARSA